MSKVALDFAPAFVGQQLRPLLPAGVDFDALQAQTDTELGRCAHDADVLVSSRTRIDAHRLRLVPARRGCIQCGDRLSYIDGSNHVTRCVNRLSSARAVPLTFQGER